MAQSTTHRTGHRLGALLSIFLLVFVTACGGGGAAPPAPPDITAQPASASAVAGAGVTFTVTATGTGLSFQWQRSVDAGASWTDILDAVAAAYTIAAVDASLNGYRFRALVSDGITTVATAPATLTVSAPVALLPRLGGAAFYQPALNATVIAAGNLPATRSLGVPGIAADGTMTWSAAKAWVQALNASRYLGHSDWRLPAVTPINGTSFQFNSPPSDPRAYAGLIDLGYNISAPGTQYAGSTASELAFLFYDVLGSVARYSPTGAPQDVSGNGGGPLTGLVGENYWTSQGYSTDGAMAFDMRNGTQYAFVAESWRFHVIVFRSGDSAP